MKEKILSLRNIHYSYGEKKVLKNISFSVTKGDFISIIGSNGCGKTTLLRIISSELKQNSGEINLFGKSLGEFSSTERSRLASFVFTLNGMLPDYTVRQFLQMHTFPHEKQHNQKQEKEIINSAAVACDIENLLSSSIRNLSSGEFQLAQIAGACIQNNRFIILDEPVSHLDPVNTKTVISLLKQLNAAGTTIITVIHDLNMALNFPGKILAMKNGNILFYEKPEQVYNKKLTDSLYDIKFTYYRRNGRYYCLSDY